MAVVLSNGDAGSKFMAVGQPNRTYVDLTAHIEEPVTTKVTTKDEGWADFPCRAGLVSVWVPQA